MTTVSADVSFRTFGSAAATSADDPKRTSLLIWRGPRDNLGSWASRLLVRFEASEFDNLAPFLGFNSD